MAAPLFLFGFLGGDMQFLTVKDGLAVGVDYISVIRAADGGAEIAVEQQSGTLWIKVDADAETLINSLEDQAERYQPDPLGMDEVEVEGIWFDEDN